MAQGSLVRVGASPPHAVVYAGLSRPRAFTIDPDGAVYVSSNGASADIGEVLRIEPQWRVEGACVWRGRP
jgi:hypothetical protein